MYLKKKKIRVGGSWGMTPQTDLWLTHTYTHTHEYSYKHTNKIKFAMQFLPFSCTMITHAQLQCLKVKGNAISHTPPEEALPAAGKVGGGQSWR